MKKSGMNTTEIPDGFRAKQGESIILSERANWLQRFGSAAGKGFLLAITSLSTLAVFFIFYYIAKDAFPFFRLEGLSEFFLGREWYPSADDATFGALPIFLGSGLVTLGAIIVATPLGVFAAICLSDILPFSLRQVVKPVIEVLAAIPSVAFGFFALVVFAPLLQEEGGRILSGASLLILAPMAFLAILIAGDISTTRLDGNARRMVRLSIYLLLGAAATAGLFHLSSFLGSIEIDTGANALNVSIILGIMAIPTIVSVSEDALQAVGRELREGSYALGATRAETLVKTVIPAALSGICAAVLLGVMRALGETMVVWMASGNAAQIPEPLFNYLEPVRTLTATIAGDMGEADHVTGSARYHVLFAMALCLLTISFAMNLASEWIVVRSRRKLGK